MLISLPVVPNSKWLFPFWAIALIALVIFAMIAQFAWACVRLIGLETVEWLRAPREWCENSRAATRMMIAWFILPWIVTILGWIMMQIGRPFRYLRKKTDGIFHCIAMVVAFMPCLFVCATIAHLLRSPAQVAEDSYWEARNL